MSMNYNDKPTTSRPKKNHTKTIITLVIVGFFAVFGGIGLYQYTQETLQNFGVINPSPSYETPTVDQVTQMCIEKLRDLLGAEPAKLSVNVCVGTVLDGLNK